MQWKVRLLAAPGALLAALCLAGAASAQRSGGVLKISFFNNLVMYDQHVAQNSPSSIVPDLATGWSWSEDGKELTFPLRQGVKWHDGKPFTAADVKCTWDLLQGKAAEKLRVNPRKAWFDNVASVTAKGEYEVTFHLKRPQS